MLFKSFTWQQFLVAAILLSSIWYFVVLLRYRRQVSAWLQQKRGRPWVEPLRRAWEEETDPEDDPELLTEDSLMGKPRLPEGLSRVGMNMFGFAPEVAKDRERQQGLVPDVIEELKSIFQVLEQENGTKADFVSLFGLVKAKYTAIAGTLHEPALNEYIREHALFPISDEELTNLWR